MSVEDIRWEQRFINYINALEQLLSAVELSNERDLTKLEMQGMIKAFEFTHELAWNVMKDYFQYQGNPSITGSRDATREAFNKGLIVEGETWMEMITSRNMSTHTYNEDTAREIVEKVCKEYISLFSDFKTRMDQLVQRS